MQGTEGECHHYPFGGKVVQNISTRQFEQYRQPFEAREFGVTGDATLDITAMTDVPKVAPERVAGLVDALDRTDAEAVVLLATDLPTLASIEALEAATGLAVLSSNSCILWSALATLGQSSPAALGRLHRH